MSINRLILVQRAGYRYTEVKIIMVYTVEQVAEILQVSVQTVRNLIRRKELKAFRVGSQFRVKKEELDRYMSGQPQ